MISKIFHELIQLEQDARYDIDVVKEVMFQPTVALSVT